MTDIVDSKRRSRIMSRIRGRDTTPELAVRRMAHRLGFRFRLHRKDLPGRPDIVFPRLSGSSLRPRMLLASTQRMPVRIHAQVQSAVLDGEVQEERCP